MTLTVGEQARIKEWEDGPEVTGDRKQDMGRPHSRDHHES